MVRPRILVTAAAGHVGTALVNQLRAGDHRVRALVRRDDARARALADLGAEVVVGDLYNPDDLATALKDVQTAWYLPPMAPHMLMSATAFAVAAQDAGVEAVVHMSQWTSHRHHPSLLTRQTWLVDELFGRLPGIASVTFNPGMFAHNFLRVIDFATLLGIFPVLARVGSSAPVSDRDLAASAAALLADPLPHAGQRFRPTGPELLDGDGMAAAIGRAIGRPVTPLPLPLWLFGKVARAQGVDPFEVLGLITYLDDIARGTFSFAGGVTDVVERLTGRPAERFEDSARRYAALPFARPTLANRARAVAGFLAAPLQPGIDFKALAAGLRAPAVTLPSASVDDPAWRASHGAQMGRSDTPALSLIAA